MYPSIRSVYANRTESVKIITYQIVYYLITWPVPDYLASACPCFLFPNAGGPIYYTGRDMKLSHKGMNISQSDWDVFFNHAGATMQALNIPQQECNDVVAFVSSLRGDIVEL